MTTEPHHYQHKGKTPKPKGFRLPTAIVSWIEREAQRRRISENHFVIKALQNAKREGVPE